VGRDAGRLTGVEAVIDKDLSAARVGALVGATTLLLLTAVERVALNFGTERQRFLRKLTVAQARRHLAAGQFPPGSMGPKMEAAVRFVEAGGREANVTPLERGRAPPPGPAR